VAVTYSVDMANFGCEDEFHDAMVLIIPSLIKLLEGNHPGLQPAVVSLLEKLVGHGEWQSCVA
jgi:hypothetical protein